jgi:hypothetical protein
MCNALNNRSANTGRNLIVSVIIVIFKWAFVVKRFSKFNCRTIQELNYRSIAESALKADLPAFSIAVGFNLERSKHENKPQLPSFPPCGRKGRTAKRIRGE